MNRWKIGDVTITRVVEMETTSKATFVLKDGSPENIRTVSWLSRLCPAIGVCPIILALAHKSFRLSQRPS
jgi:hypothetical protein